jgi:hypothetical protein
MNIKFFRTIITMCLFCFAVLCANDTKVTVAAGGIVIENQEPDIEMVSENLEISSDKIKVTYEFFNHGPTKKITVGFPLPNSPYNMDDMYPYASWDEAQIAYRFLYGELEFSHGVRYGGYTLPLPLGRLADEINNAEIINFSVLVNGKNVKFQRHMRAHNPKGEDITDLLIKHRIPISSAYLRGFCEQPPTDYFPGLKETLKKLKLLDLEGRANWYLKTTYVWEQEFLANKITHVEHSYTPSSGSYPTSFKDFDDRKNIKINRNNSLDLEGCTFDHQHYDAFLKQWRQHKEKDPNSEYTWMHEVRYILKTGANWRGPIKNFQLEIKPNSPGDLMILEGKYPMKRLSNGTFVIDLKDFKPTQDLRVCIIRIASLGRDTSEQYAFSISGVWQKVKKWLGYTIENQQKGKN